MKAFVPLFCVVFLSFWCVLPTFAPVMGSVAHTIGNRDTTSGSWLLDLSCGSACTTTLHSVDMVSATDGWAVGDDGIILHWDGARWQPVASPTTRSLDGVDMVSARDGWIVGGDSSVYGGQGIILHWGGDAWQEAPMPINTGLRSVSMVSQDDGWAVGFRSYAYGLAYNYILRWDGATWQVHDSIFEYGLKPVSVSMSGADYGWIATFDFYDAPELRRWNGENWDYVESPITLNAVAADARYGGWAVGDGFVNLQPVEKWPASPSSPLNGVALVAQNDAWAVGTDGVIYHWDGTDWRSTASPTIQTLRAVTMVSATDGWAVGDGGVILHYTLTPPVTVTPTASPTLTGTPTPTSTPMIPPRRLYVPLILAGE